MDKIQKQEMLHNFSGMCSYVILRWQDVKFYVKNEGVLYGHIKEISTVNTSSILCIFRKLCYSGNTFRRILVIFLSVTEGKWSNEALKSNVKIYIYISKTMALGSTQPLREMSTRSIS